MKFLRLEGERVVGVHSQPFHEKHGLKKTEDELKQIGVLLDEIPPKPNLEENQIARAYYNDEDGFYYKIETREEE